MKTSTIPTLLAVAALFAVNGFAPLRADAISKADNADALNLGSSWVGGVAPGAADIATWDAALTASRTYSLGADLSWLGMAVTVNPGGNLVFSSGNVLTLGAAGITMAGIDRSITFNNAIRLGTNQTWHITNNTTVPQGGVDLDGKTLTLSGGATKQFKSSISGGGQLINDGSGSIKFTNAGTAAPTTDVTLNNANLTIETSTGLASVPRTKSVTLNDGGSLTVGGRSGENTVETNANALVFGPGMATVTVSPNAAKNAMLYSGSLVRDADNNGAILFRGTSLGANTLASLTPNSANVVFGTAPALVGAGGPSGSATVSILPGVLADTAGSGTGIGLATYDSTYGLRLLDFANEYASVIVDGQATTNNVRLVNVGGGVILTNSLTSALTVVNSLSLDVTGPHGNAGIVVSGDEDAVLRLNSGILFARETGIASSNDDATDVTRIDLPLDFNGKQGTIINAKTDGMSNGNGPVLSFNVSPVNDGGEGIVFAGQGYSYLQWPSPTAFTGPVTIHSGWLRITGSGNTAVIPTKLVLDGGSVQNHGGRIADDADIEIHSGSLLVRSGDTNSGNSGSDNFRDLTMTGGSFTQGGDAGGTCNMRSATLLGGTLSLYRSTLTTVTNDMTVAGCRISLYSNNNSDRSGARLVVGGALTVSNTVDQIPYVPFNMGYSWYRNPAFLSVTNTFSVIGNAVNTNAVAVTRTYNADPKTMLAEIRLNAPVEVLVTDGAADIDFDVDAGFSDNGTVSGTLVKTGAGTLRMTASTNILSGGISVNAGRIILDGGAICDVAVAADGTLAGDGIIDGDLTFANASSFEIRLNGATPVTLDVSGAVVGSGTVEVSAPASLTEDEWKILTATSIAPTFVSADPAWSLSKRAGGTELWLAKTGATLILIR